MIDYGNAADVLFYDTFLRIKLPKEKPILVQCPLYGFNGDAIMSIGVISLPITLGTALRHLNLMLDFLVVKLPSTNNVILGRPCIRMAKTILSTYHLVVKFLTKEGIREVNGNQLLARECYFATVKGK